jgi:ankyrin repeat protein
MASRAPDLVRLLRAIAARDPAAAGLLGRSPSLALEAVTVGATRASPTEWFFESIRHHVYAGDTALHVAAAAYDSAIAAALIDLGAQVAARNRRGAQPLHYAADGSPGSATWDPPAQARVVALLVGAGADPDAFDRDGVGPLHRAVRTRSTGAVRELLARGADPRLRSGRGSTPRDLATRDTGRGGAGTPEARREQAAIIELLRAAGA